MTSDVTDEKVSDVDSDQDGPAFAWPTVVAVVVTHNPDDWLEKCLTSLSRQDYPDLTTLVVDRSDVDIAERVAKAMPTAFVRRSEKDVNFAAAINEAISSIEGATYVLICHDDVILEPGAIEHMVASTRNWMPGKKVLVSPQRIEKLSWEESKVFVDLTRDAIRTAPSYEPPEHHHMFRHSIKAS